VPIPYIYVSDPGKNPSFWPFWACFCPTCGGSPPLEHRLAPIKPLHSTINVRYRYLTLNYKCKVFGSLHFKQCTLPVSFMALNLGPLPKHQHPAFHMPWWQIHCALLWIIWGHCSLLRVLLLQIQGRCSWIAVPYTIYFIQCAEGVARRTKGDPPGRGDFDLRARRRYPTSTPTVILNFD